MTFATSSRIPAIRLMNKSGGERYRRNLQRFVSQLLKQDTAQVAFPERRQDNDDQLAGILRTLPNLQSRGHSGSRRDSDQQAFFKRQAARHGDGFVIGDGDDFIDVVLAQNGGNESGADALNFVRRRFAAGEHGAVGGLDRDGFG